ncbi:FkbM family methyltransferase [Longitalea arenae]|uniref:FkbM family methyltransferase n=1 Tax=Longitalea arenae TaxID=2812558 RepID=UPI00196871C9|nr:FkbM family methyltransferase [Longitalea arenae]
MNEDKIRAIVREELSTNNKVMNDAFNKVDIPTHSPTITEDIIRKIIREEVNNNNAAISGFVKQKDEHVPFAVYMGEGTVLTRAYTDILYLVSSYDCTLAPHFIVHGVYESELTKYFLNNVKEDSVFVDVGANFGYYSCLAAKRVNAGKGGKVHSFEANRNAFALLQKNIMINWIDWNAVSLNYVALSDSEGTVQFKNYKYRFGGSQMDSYNEDSEGINTAEIVTVNAKKMDQILGAGARVDFIKIDVEGAEFKVLKGAENVINNNPQVKLLIEWNNDQFRGHGASPEEVIAFLKGKKLQPYRLDWRDGSASEVTYDYLASTSDHVCAILFTRK